MIDINSLKENPNNPRIINKDRFEKLKKSIQEFSKMLEIRPIVIDDNDIVIGGNMRLRALKELDYKEIPDNWVVKAKDFTPEELKRFIIEDNVQFGEWDWDLLANEWDVEKLGEWGLNELAEWGKPDGELVDTKPDKPLQAIVVVAYDDINDLDKITALYELKSEDITESVKSELPRVRKMYVFTKEQ